MADGRSVTPIYLRFGCENDRIAAAQFIAELIRQGLTFEVTQDGDRFLIELTGGF